MLASWSTAQIMLVVILVFVLVVGIGALGILATEDVSVMTACSRSFRVMCGMSQCAPKNEHFSTFYCLVVYITMTVLIATLLSELIQRSQIN